MLVQYVNSANSQIEKIILKYLSVGHTIISADNFHSKVKQELEKMDKVLDFDDFV